MKISSHVISFVFGLGAALLVIFGIYFGSGGLTRFDTPLAAYAAATVFSAFAIVYRYSLWVQRPPTRVYLRAGLRLFLRQKQFLRNTVKLIGLVWSNVVAQKFIERRGHGRWVAHMCIAWGCLIAFAITFPLSWGWMQFGIAPNGTDYIIEFMGWPQFSFPPNSIIAFLFFNGLNISAVLVLIGVALAMHRRIFDVGARSVQSFSNDFLPLFLLFSVAVTGLMLTASYKLMGGSHFSFLSLLHAFTVIILLLWMPFGKLFHVIQRPAQLGVAYYKEEGAKGEQAVCARSGTRYQSKLHHDDLVNVMKELGFEFGEHQNLDPAIKRKLIAINQAAQIDGQPFVG